MLKSKNKTDVLEAPNKTSPEQKKADGLNDKKKVELPKSMPKNVGK